VIFNNTHRGNPWNKVGEQKAASDQGPLFDAAFYLYLAGYAVSRMYGRI